MRAFILRRVALIALGAAIGALGSRHSANTLRLKEFLTRNGQPFTYQDSRATQTCRRCWIASRSVSTRCRRDLLRRDVLRNPRSKPGREPGPEPGARRRRRRATWSSSARVRRGSRRRSMPPPRGSTCSCSRPRRPAARPARAHDRELSRLSHRHFRRGARRACAPRPRIRRRGRHRAAGAVRLDCDAPALQVKLADGESCRRKPSSSPRARVPEARPLRAPALRGARRLLQRHPPRGAALRKPESPSWAGATRRDRRRFSSRRSPTQVHVLVRGAGLAESMSRYLIQRIEDSPNVTLRTRTQIEASKEPSGSSA